VESSGNHLAGRRVLVVEDESLVSMLLEDALAEIGCELAGLASRFQDAMDKATSLSFDVAVLDVNLNGQQTLPIAEVLIGRGLPFVFATGYGAIGLPESLRTMPVLHKPFRVCDLEKALRTALA
jgi:CheY-like chemotaxis protein